MPKPSALFCYPSKSTFIAVDEQILKQRYVLDCVYLHQDRSLFNYVLYTLYSCLKILLSPKLKTVFIWFADYHAMPIVLLAKLMKLSSVVFIGGYDAVYYPELRMGVHANVFRGFCNKQSLKNCSLIIANHESLVESMNCYYSASGHPDGIKRFIPNLKTKTSVVYNGINLPESSCFDNERIPNSILSVGTTPRFEDIFNKGYDFLIELARLKPEWKVTIVGIKEAWHQRITELFDTNSIPNLKIIPYLLPDKLPVLYQSSKVYVQASISEGMPNALIEAMYYSCVAVGSNVAGIPTLIGDKGIIVNHRDINEIEKAIETALHMENDKSIGTYIKNNYNVEIRSRKLNSVLNECGL